MIGKKKLSVLNFSMGKETEDWNIGPTCRPFRGLPKGLVLVLPESTRWQERASGWEPWKTKAKGLDSHTLTHCSSSPGSLQSFRRTNPTPSFSLGRERVEHESNITAFWGTAWGANFCLSQLKELMGPSLRQEPGGHCWTRGSWTACSSSRKPALKVNI